MKNIILILIFFLFFLPANCFSASDKIYSWIDKEGFQHFSDNPTYSVEQESKEINLFLIDRHGEKQDIKPKKMIGVEASKKQSVNIVFLFFLVILLFVFLKVVVA
ncbi:MAG: DUF4124 domain-containing protein, partial [Proteobacteria bacterium]|nr:DUF4124 domain-containing protein [Pseudomonadota bacterium]